jgi:two-component system, cell cycle sensor histidine kinase and response regulator CckA
LSFYDPARILVVDDDPALQLSLKTGLEMYGFEVITASDGLEAMTEFRTNGGSYDAIVTDHEMPRMTGLEFVRAVREVGFKGRIVVVSGHLSVEDLHAYEMYGISGFFHEPFGTALLATLLLRD